MLTPTKSANRSQSVASRKLSPVTPGCRNEPRKFAIVPCSVSSERLTSCSDGAEALLARGCCPIEAAGVRAALPALYLPCEASSGIGSSCDDELPPVRACTEPPCRMTAAAQQLVRNL